MPLFAVPVELPSDVVEVHAGDLNGDGSEELIAVSHTSRRSGPPATTLTVFGFTADGRQGQSETISLGVAPILWDVHAGLYGVGPGGPLQLSGAGVTRLLDEPTMLALLGPTEAKSVDLVDDLNTDGVPEVLFHADGRIRVVSVDGRDWGGVDAGVKGSLSSKRESGGGSVHATVRWPSVVVADADGDGLKDLLLPEGRRLTVLGTADRIGARRAEVRLPVELTRPETDKQSGAVKRKFERAWFQDVDGDGRVDLVTQHWLVDGSWFGSTAEVAVFLGSGSGFGAAKWIRTQAAPLKVSMVDFDGDGDLDLLTHQIDTGFGNLTRALVSRRVQMSLRLFPMEQGAWRKEALELRSVAVSVEQPGRLAASIEADVDGDGGVDAVIFERGEPLQVYASQGLSLADTPLGEVEIAAQGEDVELVVRDFTGDGRADILVWSVGASKATLVVLR